jgi:excinuclease ABC subunit C
MANDKEQNEAKAIIDQIKTLPTGPGLYIMKGSGDKVFYIGKAKSLRSRVMSYFQPSADLLSTRGPKIVELVEKVESIDFIETANEVDAVLQEARLIKDIRPPYNTDLVDDKTFPYLEIVTGDDFPGVYITRKPREKGSRLFGFCQGFASGTGSSTEDIQVSNMQPGYKTERPEAQILSAMPAI